MFQTGIRPLRGMFLVPLVYAVAGIAFGMLLPRLEARVLPDLTLGLSLGSAQVILSTIASGMMALTAIVFSVAFVMVQFSATAYSPRLVMWLARSPVINHSIGIFTATFLYAIAALAWVDRGGSGRVPPVAAWFAVLLLFASVVFFVLLIEKIGMLQVTRILTATGDAGRKVISRMYPEASPTSPGRAPGSAAADDSERPPVILTVEHHGGPLVVQAVRTEALVALAARTDVVIVMAVAVGDTVMDGMPILRIFGKGAPPPAERLGGRSNSGPIGRSSRTRSTPSGSWWMSPSRRCRLRSTTRRPPCRRSIRSRTSSCGWVSATWMSAACATPTGG